MKWTNVDVGIFIADELARLGESKSKSFVPLDSQQKIGSSVRSEKVQNFDHITINAVDFLASCSLFTTFSSKNND